MAAKIIKSILTLYSKVLWEIPRLLAYPLKQVYGFPKLPYLSKEEKTFFKLIFGEKSMLLYFRRLLGASIFT